MTHPAVRLVDIRASRLDVDEVLQALDEDASGGLVLFVGRVRNHDAGRAVEGIEYSAHPRALAQLSLACERVAAAHDVRGLAAIHRVGPLEVGEAAVIVATVAPHRGTAFAASRALIDTVKDVVPIWKHQRLRDGTRQWVGSV